MKVQQTEFLGADHVVVQRSHIKQQMVLLTQPYKAWTMAIEYKLSYNLMPGQLAMEDRVSVQL